MSNPSSACSCGHAIEQHGHDPRHPGSTACTECDCIAFESDPEAESDPLSQPRDDPPRQPIL